MSGLSCLEKLLDGVEVEWTELGEIAKIKHGKDWKNLESGAVPVYGSGGVMGYVNKYSYDKPTVLIPRKGTITNIFYVDIPFWNVDTIYYTDIATSKIIPKYFYHFMKSLNLMALDTGSGRPSLTQAILNKLLIPIPCPDNPEKSLAIQSEIVRILDAFTALTNELTNELKLRKQQYNYYREQLLSFDDGSTKFAYLEKLLDGAEVEWKVLGDVAKKIYSGGTPDTKKTEYWEGGTFPWMSSGEVNLKTVKETEKYITEAGLNNSSAKLVPKNSVVMALAGQGKTRGKVARTRIALTTNQSLAALTFDEKKINSDYIFYFLETQYESLRQISSGNSGRGGLNLQMISAYKVPVPCPNNPEKSLAIQSEIVRILDKFDTLTNSISEGLPREIELRKKQYEHYRNLLFSFPKPVADN
ncbi:restriction endonuclease subunit S [Salmonella enterica subsp. enterica serovar Oranienburg]|uniref:Restriction endonuclease subunit S n=1 Tax=Salmonella enterica TaxID=28901 RepID=A0A742LJY4_SALER|nr:restriction endonuclease subunit S [Salmonella enterica subsp. enterica serovar Oranienburg]ECD5833162.1 restriction endonuclease subunit S [Salmonella enterica subsp. enterica serovar Newport]EEG7582203.1 restriction endonuclease subunit S [Salmonella enterica]EBY8947697.1 restriction endonuclease subunit S [Salmonella enterica subsp. enterica serovar Oranienburg]EGJ1639728.1 restriction endonuclease subunit S [Salmonella enterica]